MSYVDPEIAHPDASPDLLGGPPRRGAGVRRLNRLPLLMAFGVGAAVVGAVAYTYQERLAVMEREQAAQEGAVAPADATALFRNAPESGLIAQKQERRPEPAAAPVVQQEVTVQTAQKPDDYQRQRFERWRTDLEKVERDRRIAWANALQADTTVKATGNKPAASSASMSAGGETMAQLASLKQAALQRADDLQRSGGGGAGNGAGNGGGGSGGSGAPMMMGGGRAGGFGMDAMVASAADPDPNKQQSKADFLAQTPANGQYLNAQRVGQQSRCEVKAGTVIPSVMIGGVNSDLPGQIIGQVAENVWDSATGQCLMIPQGTRLVGTYDNKVSYGQERVLVAWTWLKLPDGSSVNLGLMPGADQSGYAGFSDEVDNHYWRTFGNAILLSLFSAGISLSQVDSDTSETSSTETAASAMGIQLGQLGAAYAQKGMNLAPTLKIRNGYRFNVMVTKDMVLPEWRGHPLERR